MTDSCLEVNYAVLDYDVLSRKNSMLLPDSANSAGTQTTADIDRYLRRFAAEALVDDVFSLESSTQSFPRNDVPKESAIAYQLRSALEFVCLKPQRYDLGQFAEAAGYLSHMVRWDWIHQGKEPAPSSIAPEYALVDGIDDVHLHSYRVGMRRTRMNTYRAHIKRMPPEMQLFIVNWSKYCL
ncbi:hypothetical protein LPJ56_001637 [Coemansia sp. RSA 2599]|nr:hypothetical protein LPJ75_001241 [Coemansia sp. RSA 2598]KAJ1827490.1 hypothetical protein LPJ56_001637 [Coemansia sp. RSA 2599]